MSSGNKSYFYDLTMKYGIFPPLTMIILLIWLAALQGRKQLICCKTFLVTKLWLSLVKIDKKYNSAEARSVGPDQKNLCSFSGTLKLLRSDLHICVTTYKGCSRLSLSNHNHSITGLNTPNAYVLNFVAHLTDRMLAVKKKLSCQCRDTFQKVCAVYLCFGLKLLYFWLSEVTQIYLVDKENFSVTKKV